MRGFHRPLRLLTDPSQVASLYANFTAKKGIATGASWTAQTATGSNGRVLSQSSAGNQPVYIANDTDGLPSVSFNGSSTCLVGGTDFSLPGDPALTVLCLCAPGSVAQGAYQAPFGWGSGSGTASCFSPLLNYPNATQVSLQTGNGNGVAWPATGDGQMTTAFQLLTFRKTPGPLATTVSVRRNGRVLTPLSGASTATPAYTTGTLAVGRFADYAGYWWGGKIRHILIYTRALTLTEILQTEAFVRAQWTYLLRADGSQKAPAAAPAQPGRAGFARVASGP